MISASTSATDADVARYREALGKSRPSEFNLVRRIRSILYAFRETQGYARAVSKAYGVSRATQVFALANAHFHRGMLAETFYLHQCYLPERRGLWRRYVTPQGQWALIKRHGCPDFSFLVDKIAFSQKAVMLGIRTIPILATFVENEISESPPTEPRSDLFSKPSTSSEGKCTTLWRYDGETYRSSNSATALRWDALLRYLREQSKISRPFLLQPAEHNHPGLRPLTNGALATVRIVTCRTPSGSIDLMPAALRMPWGKAVADNLARGGLVAPVDLVTGYILGPAYRKDEKLGIRRVDTHPDTNTRIEGFQIPYGREAIELSIAAHAAFSSMFFIAWDIAMLDDGPVVLEGNPLWDANVILLSHRITLADTQFVPYWLYHYNTATAAVPPMGQRNEPLAAVAVKLWGRDHHRKDRW